MGGGCWLRYKLAVRCVQIFIHVQQVGAAARSCFDAWFGMQEFTHKPPDPAPTYTLQGIQWWIHTWESRR